MWWAWLANAGLDMTNWPFGATYLLMCLLWMDAVVDNLFPVAARDNIDVQRRAGRRVGSWVDHHLDGQRLVGVDSAERDIVFLLVGKMTHHLPSTHLRIGG